MRKTPIRPRRFPAVLLGALLLTGLAAPAARSEEDPFPCPESLRPAVDFWIDVFTRFDRNQVVFFDALDVTRVYEIHRLPPADERPALQRAREEIRDALRDRIRSDLEALAAPGVDYDSLAGRRHRLFTVWEESRDPETYRRAAENLRAQRGARESFLAGVERSARYMDSFRAIFREEGVPEDLVFLPHVESSFRWDARSEVGALGMWQFMSYTGRQFLHIHPAVDERLDPWSASRAAARYLRSAWEELGSWPLAITSYNQGVASMLNARLSLDTTDIERIIREYRGPRFGFAGRNFYAEFLAAREAASRLLAEPDGLQLQAPVEWESYVLPAFVKLGTVARAFGLSPDELASLNLGVTAAARSGNEYLPRGYALKVPVGVAGRADAMFAAIPAGERPLQEPQRTYRVRRGESLGQIAGKFGTTVRALQKLNRIKNPNRLRAGQVLRLPG